MSLKKIIELNNGLKMPQIGFGTWLAPPGQVGNAVEIALKAGYTHIDCAVVYGNQQEVGDGIRRSGVPRSNIFITSKLWNNMHKPENVEKALDETLRQLGPGIDYLDLYLMHFPVSFIPTENSSDYFPEDPAEPGKAHLDHETSVLDTWKAMIAVLKSGKVRSIGVSNCTIEVLKVLLTKSEVVPVVNQVERHPRLSQPELIEWCHEQKIVIQAYSPLGNNELDLPKVIDQDEWQAYAKKLGKDPGQVAIAWCRTLPAAHTKSGTDIPIVVLTKSVTEKRIKTNFEDFELTTEQLKEIDGTVRPKLYGEGPDRRNVPNKYKPSWNVNIWDDPREQDAKYKVKAE